MRLVGTMAFCVGFIHADLHPGAGRVDTQTGEPICGRVGRVVRLVVCGFQRPRVPSHDDFWCESVENAFSFLLVLCSLTASLRECPCQKSAGRGNGLDLVTRVCCGGKRGWQRGWAEWEERSCGAIKPCQKRFRVPASRAACVRTLRVTESHVRVAGGTQVPGTPQLVILDHGLYTRLSDEMRLEYCRLWRAPLTRASLLHDKLPHASFCG